MFSLLSPPLVFTLLTAMFIWSGPLRHLQIFALLDDLFIPPKHFPRTALAQLRRFILKSEKLFSGSQYFPLFTGG
jgi:hypothetical protein